MIEDRFVALCVAAVAVLLALGFVWAIRWAFRRPAALEPLLRKGPFFRPAKVRVCLKQGHLWDLDITALGNASMLECDRCFARDMHPTRAQQDDANQQRVQYWNRKRIGISDTWERKL